MPIKDGYLNSRNQITTYKVRYGNNANTRLFGKYSLFAIRTLIFVMIIDSKRAMYNTLLIDDIQCLAENQQKT